MGFEKEAAIMNISAPQPGRTLSSLDHKLHKSGTFCFGNHIAPLVMLLGCQRCGTGSLFEDIMTHVRGAHRGHSLHGEPDYYSREMHFFATDSWSLGVRHYLDHFPACPKGKAADNELAFAVDATPAYLRKPIVATRLHEVYPTVAMPAMRFVVILRDPVDRLHAYWDAFVQSGNGVNDFGKWSDIVLETTKICQKAHGPELWPPPDTGKCDADVLEGVAAGLYVYQLRYWLKSFSPARFLVTTLDAYERSTGSVLRDISGFVGQPSALLGTPRAIGTPSNPFAVKVMGAPSAHASKTLGTFYHPHNGHLHKFLESQPHAHLSPSLAELGIGRWYGND